MVAPTTQPDPAVISYLMNFREELDNKETAMMERMARQWLAVDQRLSGDMELLAEQLSRAKALGDPVTEQLVWKMERYQLLQGKVEFELNKYNREFGVPWISKYQDEYARMGILSAEKAIKLQIGQGAYFPVLSLDQVNTMIGFAGDGSPLYNLLKYDYPDAMDGMLKSLINGVARGLPINTVAKEMSAGFGMGLERATLIARTEILRTYRMANTKQYRESGVTNGFRRLVKKATACMACLLSDGQWFDNEQELSDHPRGKCIAVPIVQGVGAPNWELGPRWFKGLPEERQRELMGPETFAAWKAGKFDLMDLVSTRHSDIWGDSPQTTSLAKLLGGSKGTTFFSAPKPPPPPPPPAAGMPDFKTMTEARLWLARQSTHKVQLIGNLTDQETVNRLLHEIEDLSKRGYKMPEILIYHDAKDGKVAYYRYASKQISINTYSSSVNNISMAERQVRAGFWSDKSVLSHELGHAQHHMTPGAARAINMDKFPNRLEKMIAKEVSGYAQSEPAEFIAEVFSGMNAGLKYSEQVMNLYQKYHGPKVLP